MNDVEPLERHKKPERKNRLEGHLKHLKGQTVSLSYEVQSTDYCLKLQAMNKLYTVMIIYYIYVKGGL